MESPEIQIQANRRLYLLKCKPRLVLKLVVCVKCYPMYLILECQPLGYDSLSAELYLSHTLPMLWCPFIPGNRL